MGARGDFEPERLEGGLSLLELRLDLLELGFSLACARFPVGAGIFQIANADGEGFRLPFAFAGPFFPPVATPDEFGNQNPRGSEERFGGIECGRVRAHEIIPGRR